MVGLYFAVGGTEGYCANHPGASSCSPNSAGAEVFAIVIVAVVVALALFGLWWRYGNKDSDGPLTRLFLAMARRFGSGNPR